MSMDVRFEEVAIAHGEEEGMEAKISFRRKDERSFIARF